MNLRNWWCSVCERFVASEEIDLRHIHGECGGKCEYREFHPCVFVRGCELYGMNSPVESNGGRYDRGMFI
jgi:hypothetical protein